MNLKEQLAKLQKSMQAIVAGAKASGRDLTDDEMTDLEAKADEAQDLKGKIESAEKSAALMDRIGGMKSDSEAAQDESPAGARAKSLGAHFIKHMGDRSLKERGTIAAPEFKAAEDTQAHGGNGGAYGPLLTDVDRLVRPPGARAPGGRGSSRLRHRVRHGDHLPGVRRARRRDGLQG